ncbi:hypothetical protein LTR22_014892 [Elasticomyces elasticus]|nr:hypothetical protein LTR22_014892 [Elasticomyces elasticus]KAK4914351.1 hypothetical protein LTR49_017382 [Elasticomyces elasticus]KAK5753868.1 hypothetical protein LTS12_016071 [Elasticomyces elasticus]
MGSLSTDLVLLTDGTGHLGFRDLITTLENGYSVRAVVRSEKKADIIKNNAVSKALNLGSRLTFAIVPDFVVDGAFDEAANGVRYIIHVASPIPTSTPADADIDKEVVKPAVQGNIGLLESARKAGGITRVVVTSSVIAMLPLSALQGVPLSDTIDAESRVPDIPGPFTDVGFAYVASKIAALNSGERWSGTNKYPLNVVLGLDAGVPAAPAQVNYVSDTALAHVRALDPKVKGNQAFILSTNGTDMEYDDAKMVAEKYFSQSVKDGILPNTGSLVSIKIPLDNSKTERVLGKEMSSYETATKTVLEHYLEIYEKEHKGQRT